MYTHIDGAHGRVPVGKYKIGMIAEQRKEHLTNDVPNDPRVGDHEWARREGMVAFAGYPLMIEDRLVGVMAMFARRPLSESALRAMGTMAFGIALSIDRKQAEAELRQSEEQVRLLLESSGEGIYGVDTDGCCTFCNPAGMRMLGYDDPSQLLGKSMHRLVHHTRADGRPFPEAECQISHSIHGGEGAHTDQEIFWRRDGTSFPVDYQSRPIYRGDQRLGAVVTFADISNRRAVEETMRLRDRSLAAISQGLFITDPSRSDEPIVYVNAAFEVMTGYSQAEVAGRDIGLLRCAETGSEEFDELKAALAGRRNCTVELVLQRKDETPYWASLSVSVVQDASGRATHFVGVMTDISEHKRAEEELRAAKEAAEAASRSKSTFLANMSHELRTPLNAIIGYSEMLQEENQGEGNEELVADLQRIHGAGKHLLGLINDILDLSKIEAGKLDLYLETFGVPEMIRGVVGTIRPLIEKNGNTLEVICPEEIGSMRADLTKVRQALLNLLSNASKFTEHGTVTITVARQEADERDWLSIEVRDSGIGMKPDQMGRLFQPFMQADSSTTRKYGGTGLGLMITRRFCQMMGGDIAVKSAEGVGSTFTIRLPIDVPEIPTQPSDLDLSVYSSNVDSGRLVLVIDDDPTVSNLMRRTLEKDGFRVQHAPGGERGLAMARELKPAVITLDVMMPGMDGWTVLTSLKAEPELADIPVVMVTIVDDRNLGYALGASDYLTKPIDRARLAATLKKFGKEEPGRTALVVDDDLVTRELVREFLRKDGWTVIEAENGRAGLERMKASVPDVILLDLMMPEMDGFVFAKEVRCVEEWRSIPILVLTAKDLTLEDRERLNGDIRTVLQKSAYTRDQLLQQIRREVAESIRVREESRLETEPVPV
jgi:PAS domain S-box-containing protein